MDRRESNRQTNRWKDGKNIDCQIDGQTGKKYKDKFMDRRERNINLNRWTGKIQIVKQMDRRETDRKTNRLIDAKGLCIQICGQIEK